jgi:uncharacterized repeat protein (TIGR01451 family)
MRTKRTQFLLCAPSGNYSFNSVFIEAILSKPFFCMLILGFTLFGSNCILAEIPPPTSCGAPISFTLSNITVEGCDLNFLPSDTTINISYDYEIQPRDSAQGSASLILSGNTGDIDSVFTLTGLNAATFYSVYVRAVCETNIASEWLEPVDLYTLPTCESLWYDSGGPDGGALMNANEIVSICPGDSNQVVSVVFTSFDVENRWDVLYIYDGPNTTFPKLFSNTPATYGGFPAGGISGSNLPNDGFPIYSNHSSGCLTFKFLSDGDVSSPGWSAELNCEDQPTCGSIFNPVVTSFTANTATISASASLYGEIQSIIWELQPQGVAQGTMGGIMGVSDSIPLVLDGLTGYTDYSAYFQADCGDGDSSTWTGGLDFRTAPDCANAIQIEFGVVYNAVFGGLGQWNLGPDGTGASPWITHGVERLFRLEIPYTGQYILRGLEGNGWVDYFIKDATQYPLCDNQNWIWVDDVYSYSYYEITLNAGVYYLLLDAENTIGISQYFRIEYSLQDEPQVGNTCNLPYELNCTPTNVCSNHLSNINWYKYEAEFDSEFTIGAYPDSSYVLSTDIRIKVFEGSCEDSSLIFYQLDSELENYAAYLSFNATAGTTYWFKIYTVFGNCCSFCVDFDCGGGCTDSTACNYYPEASFDSGVCSFGEECTGCTDNQASNFNTTALYDDGSCLFSSKIKVFCDSYSIGTYQESEMTINLYPVYIEELDSIFFTDELGNLQMDLPLGTYHILLVEYPTLSYTTPTSGIITVPSYNTLYFGIGLGCINRCMDPNACNYNPAAIIDNGLCLYGNECDGCINSSAINYDPSALMDDGSCIFNTKIIVFCDHSGNGLLESNEFPAEGFEVYVPEVDSVFITNSSGEINLQLNAGNYNASLQFNNSIQTTTPINILMSVPSVGTWYFGLDANCGPGCTDSTACNYEPLSIGNNDYCLYGSDCEDCINPLAENYNPYATIDNGSCVYSGNIKVYYDYNLNGVYNSIEPGMPNFGIYFPSLDMTVFTDAQGEIHEIIEPGTYSVQLILNSGFVSTSLINATITIPSATVTYFGIVPSANLNYSLSITKNIQSNFHCTNGYTAGACAYYYSADPIRGYMTMTCDPMLTLENYYDGIAPDSVNSGYAEWNIEPFANSIFAPRFHVDGPGVNYVGQTFNFDFHLVLYNDNDDVVYADEWTLSPTITCAYDPNIIEVDPIGYADPHYVASGEHLQYKVQFQNTGNAPASDVHIEDFLDPLVYDLSTFAPVVSSHNMNTCLHGDGSVDFVFNNINLPDSASNEQGSHGFLIYNVDLLDILEHNVVASNYADIYFEENPAVTTNTVFNTIFDCNTIIGITGPNSFCENDEVEFTAEQDFIESYNWQVEGTSYSNNSIFSASVLPSGVQNLELILTNPICEETRSLAVNIHPLPNLNAGSVVFVCEGEELLLNAESDEPVSWSNGMENGTSFTPEENLQLIATSVSAFGCAAIDSMSIEIVALPTMDIVQSGYELTAPEGCCWQWYLNNISITGLTGQSITAMAEGVYYVVTTNDEGCTSTSESIVVIGINENEVSTITVYPNPLKTSATILLPEGIFDLSLYDVAGKLVSNYGKHRTQFVLERADLPSGHYQLTIVGDSRIMSLQLIME